MHKFTAQKTQALVAGYIGTVRQLHVAIGIAIFSLVLTANDA